MLFRFTIKALPAGLHCITITRVWSKPDPHRPGHDQWFVEGSSRGESAIARFHDDDRTDRGRLGYLYQHAGVPAGTSLPDAEKLLVGKRLGARVEHNAKTGHANIVEFSPLEPEAAAPASEPPASESEAPATAPAPRRRPRRCRL